VFPAECVERSEHCDP